MTSTVQRSASKTDYRSFVLDKSVGAVQQIHKPTKKLSAFFSASAVILYLV